MTHIAIVEQVDGKSADWLEKLSDEQYEGRGISYKGHVLTSNN